MKQIIKEAMARLDGMLECNVPVYDVVYGPDPHTFSHYRIRYESEWPDYTDMNVLHRMVCGLLSDERIKFVSCVRDMWIADGLVDLGVPLTEYIACLTDNQITEALLRTAGTWTDEMEVYHYKNGGAKMKPIYKADKHIVTKDGHSMFTQDIVKDLNALQQEVAKLERGRLDKEPEQENYSHYAIG